MSKRQKSVFTSNEIAHVWANEGAPSGRCPSSMSFVGDAFFSYSTVIARRIKSGGKVAFVLDGATFSPSTSGHQSAARQALRDTEKTFFVQIGWRAREYQSANGYTFGGRRVKPSRAIDNAMFALKFTPATLRDFYLLNARTTGSAAKSKFAHIRAGDIVRQQGERELALEVCEFFGLNGDKVRGLIRKHVAEVTTAELIVDAKEKRNAELRATREARLLAGKIARAIATAEAVKLDESKLAEVNEHGWGFAPFGQDLHLLGTRPDLQSFIREKMLKLNAIKIEAWRAGKVSSRELPYDLPTMLRFESGAGEYPTGPEVVTSKGARVPFADAERGYRFASQYRNRAESNGWKRNGEKFKVGYYDLDRVNSAGVVAGCHRIAWEEIDNFARLVGWAPPPRSFSGAPVALVDSKGDKAEHIGPQNSLG